MEMPNTLKIMSDKDLFTLIRNDQESGFDQLYKHYCCTLYGLAINAVGSKEHAEEIVQLTFVKIWNRIELVNDLKISVCVWIIQNLIITIQDFLTSKNISYKFNMNNFPNFTFELIENDDKIVNHNTIRLQTI